MFVLRPLSQRPIAFLWTGQVLAAVGSEFYMVAVVWLAADFVGRNAGYVSAVQSAALLAGSLLGGVVTDRWRHGTTMIAADLVRVVLMIVLSVAGLLHVLTLWLLVSIAGCVALLTSAFDPALQATLPRITVNPRLRHATNGLFDATKRMARILGPSMIALVNGFLPKTQFFFVTCMTFLLSALAVRGAMKSMSPFVQDNESSRKMSVIDSLVGGWGALRGHALMIYGLTVVLIGNLTWGMGIVLGMMLYLRESSVDPLTDYSLMIMAYGIGNLTANLIFASIRPVHPARWIIISKLIFGSGVFLLPCFHHQLWLMVVAALTAINGPLENLAMLHLMQTRLPPDRLAQVYRLQMCAIFSGLLIAYVISPSLYGWFGLAPMIMAAGAVTFASGLMGIGLIIWKRRRTRLASI